MTTPSATSQSDEAMQVVGTIGACQSVGSILDARAVQPGCSETEHLLALARSNGIDHRRVGEVLATVGLG